MTEILETVVILAGMASIWFRYILGWNGILWQAFVYVMLVLLVCVLIRRVRRFNAALKEHKKREPL